ncbi:MAG: FAD-dependent oxidoreductase [Planctomycetota bacterium]|nr:MAG: FAD-dependent oxidoreductase [Planctomycetota bacterium]
MPNISRIKKLEELKNGSFDATIIGGGINGAVSAAVLSSHGLKVALIEMNDFASGTSQESSNLVWGGIKYLESYEFKLVWNLCKSRNQLIKQYPANIKEIRFLTSIQKNFRKSSFTIYLGSLLYWGMGRFFTKHPIKLSNNKIELIEPIINTEITNGGLEYSDAYLIENDARFTFQFIKTAWDNKTCGVNYTELKDSVYEDGKWKLKIHDKIGEQFFDFESKVLINATGPFLDAINNVSDIKTDKKITLSKGIHLIVPQITKARRVITFFSDDGRLFFIIPMGNKTCIGTTDTAVDDPDPSITKEDIQFVLENINKRLDLNKPIEESDVISTRCGVRPLVIDASQETDDDWLQLSRKHVLEVNKEKKHISIFGGKLTDCINIGEEIHHEVKQLGLNPNPYHENWYGEPTQSSKHDFEEKAKQLTGLMKASNDELGTVADRIWRRYYNNADEILNMIKEDETLLEDAFEATGLLKAEIEFMKNAEMVTCTEDILRRRSNIGLLYKLNQTILEI